MRKNRWLGAALTLLVWGAGEVPRAEASKVSMQGEAVRKTPAREPQWAEKEVTAAGAPRDRNAVTPQARPAGQEPVRWDALPEKDRKSRTADELLGKLAEV